MRPGNRSRLWRTGAAARTAAAGFTLIEVLIALLVFSIGLLGLAAMQTATVQFNQGAYLRSQATNLAYEMADRMRANRRAAVDFGAYDGVGFSAPACGTAIAGTVVERDIAAWRNGLACRLPGGDGRVVRNGRLVTISVRWDESRGAEPPEVFEMTTSL